MSGDPTCKTGCDLGLLTDWVSRVLHCGKNHSTPGRQALWHIRDKLYPRGRIREDSDQAERKEEKCERHGVVPVPVVPLERGVLSRQTAVAVETIKRAISGGVLPLMSLIILLLTFCAVICIPQRHRPPP